MALFTRSKTPGEARPQGAPAPGDPELEGRIRALGMDLLQEARRQRGGVLSRAFWSGKLIDWAMKDEAFKVQLFRFVDAFPSLRTPAQVHDHLVDYLAQPGVTPPPGLGVGVKAGGLLKGALAKTVSAQITSMAERFIAGASAEAALPQLRRLWSAGVAFSVDLLGEACVSDAEAAAYQRKYLDLVRALPAAVRDWPADDRLERDHLGPIPRSNVSVKISALYARADAIEFEGSLAGLAAALRPVLEAARDGNVFVNFDIESHALKDLTIDLFLRCAEAVEFPAGIALQAYLRSGDADAERVIRWARSSGRVVTVRLVKGAYWDYEAIRAEQMGWPVPVWSRKADTDACFERMAAAFVAATPDRPGRGGIRLALGSHNLRSIAAGLALVERRGLPPAAIEVQCLHGMGEEIKAALVERGVRVREYVPVGEMIPGMAYLVRRLLENTSNESWLRASVLDESDPETLLASPHPRPAEPPGAAPERHALSPAPRGVGDGRPFFNEPLRDFADVAQRERFAEAVARARPPAAANDGTAESARAAVGACLAAFPAWRDADPRKRAATIAAASRSARRARPGARPTPTSARRSTSASTTPGWPSGSSSRGASAPSRASSTRSSTSPGASPSSSAPGTSRSRSAAA
jgi:RHH-type proline utilization regulon transcriptional repressor/proline dehydrogenase/delta 1-pyrroline-5-carboxylate dehydrogenase